MNNFGVIELAGGKTTSAPGWAYVPDTRLNVSATLAAGKKRARNLVGGALSMNDLTARQETRIRKELEALDKDGGRDAAIPVPVKPTRRSFVPVRLIYGSLANRNEILTWSTLIAQIKHTANVRKILTSQKNFANHLDDFLALQALEANAAANTSKRAKKDDDDTETTGEKPKQTYDILSKPFRATLIAHAGDADPLLMSRVPPLPSDEEMKALLGVPALTYAEAKGSLEENRYPRRLFCEVCGYWGRVRCMKCGTRICALECLNVHRQECVTRYGI